MRFTDNNWIIPLRSSILERGSLYPNSEQNLDLNLTNWLKLLRDDILERGSLYPSFPTDKTLTKSNFLVKLRNSIVERGSLYPGNARSPYLTSLSIRNLTLEPLFDPNIYYYTTGTSGENETAMAIDVDPEFSWRCLFDNGHGWAVYTPGETVILYEGANSFHVEVSNSDGETATYLAMVIYTPPSTAISTLLLTGVTLDPPFDSNLMDYTGVASDETTDMEIYLEDSDAKCAASLNGTAIPLEGANPFKARIAIEASITNILRIEITNGPFGEVKRVYQVSITR